MDKELEYYNAPIVLLKDFLINSNNCLSDILHFSVMEYSVKLHGNDEVDKFIKSIKYHGAEFPDIEKAFLYASNLYQNLKDNAVYFQIRKSVFWEYYCNEKSDFEKVCLLAFLGIKSILGKKGYCKITNDFLLSRMAGFAKTQSDVDYLLQKYSNEYQLNKIKRELRDNWGLIYYGRYTRGFYVTLELPLDELVYQVEKKRKATKEKQYMEQQKQALAKAMQRINDQVTTK